MPPKGRGGGRGRGRGRAAAERRPRWRSAQQVAEDERLVREAVANDRRARLQRSGRTTISVGDDATRSGRARSRVLADNGVLTPIGEYYYRWME